MSGATTLRLVVDTNVLVSALLQPRGPSGEILRAWRDNRVELVVCPSLLAELAQVLGRPRLRRRVEARLATSFVALLRAQAELRANPTFQPGLTPDPKDDFIVALARSVRADVIVSGDQHLTGMLGSLPPVVAPAELVELLGKLGV